MMGKELLERIEAVYDLYRDMPLPKDRLEFEERCRVIPISTIF